MGLEIDFIKLFKENGYTYISGECTAKNQKVTVEDVEGYRYNVSLIDLSKHRGVFLKYNMGNPYTIYNINNYCNINNVSTKLLENTYTKNNVKMMWECGKCGSEFSRDLIKFKDAKAYYCPECSKKQATINSKKNIDIIRDCFLEHGLTPLFNNYNKNSEQLKCMDLNGYLYLATYSGLQSNQIPRFVDKCNPYSVYNINKYCENNGILTTLHSTEYNGNSQYMEWKCGKCGEIYSATWQHFKARDNYHYCSKCSNRKAHTKKTSSFNYKNILCMANKLGYEILSTKTPTSYCDKLVCRDADGYLYYVLCSTIMRECKSNMVHPSNPYSIGNIKRYIQNNALNTRIISTTYKSSAKNLLFECETCNETFSISWNDFHKRKTINCKKCRKVDTLKKIRTTNWKDIVEKETSFEYKLLKVNYPNTSKGEKEVMLDVLHTTCGRSYSVIGHGFKGGTRCRDCSMKKMGEEKRDTIENFKEYVTTITDGEYECLSDKYERSNIPIKMIHKTCGHIYNVTPASFKGNEGRDGRRCPKCASLLQASYTHVIMSLLFEKYFIDVEFEYDAGFRTKKGGISKYDLYVEPLNLVIEWQSKYHDTKRQKQIDEAKRKYAIENGYEYLALDHRDFTTIQYVKMFFPFLKRIPRDLDLSKFRKFNVALAQGLLDDGKSIMQASKIMNTNCGDFYNALNTGTLTYPIGYFEKYKQSKRVVQLTLDGEFVNKYESVAKAQRDTGFKSISNACNRKVNHSGGYFWVFEDSYLTGDYILPNKEECIVYGKSICQLDKNGVLVGEYESQLDAQNKTGILAGTISRGMKKGGYAKGYYWIYKEDYESGNYKLGKYKEMNKEIVQLSDELKVIKIWSGQAEAKRNLGYINIAMALKDTNRKAGGFRWMYGEDYEQYLKQNK